MSPRVLFVAFCWALFTLGGVSPLLLCADEKVAGPEVAKLLEVGWGESFRSLQPAQEHYDRAKAAAPASASVPYAFALVHLKHRKYPEAARLLDEALTIDKRHLPAREARIWIDMLLKKYPSALVQIEQLAGLLSRDDDATADEKTRARQAETARYLGRLLGFLDGPGQKAVDADRVDGTHRAVQERLSTTLRKEFEAGHQTVTDRFEELYLATELSKEQAKADAEKSRKRESERLAGDKEAIDKARKAVAERAAGSREELDKILSEIEKKLAPLDREYGRLAAQAQRLRDLMNGVDREISQLLALAEGTDDPVLQMRYRREIDRLEATRRSYNVDYRALEGQAARVRAEQAALISERDGAIGRYNAEAKRLGREQYKLSGKEKRLARDDEKNRRPLTGSTDKVRIQADRALAFTTYEPFPLEQAKASVLEALKQ